MPNSLSIREMEALPAPRFSINLRAAARASSAQASRRQGRFVGAGSRMLLLLPEAIEKGFT
jgi:hypothetical protein